MSTLIELAVQRLEQLRKAGVAVTGHEKLPTAAPQLPAGQRTPQSAKWTSLAKADHPVSKQVELDAGAMAAAYVHVPNSEPSPQADQFRLMKRPLIRNVAALREQGQSRSNLIMVTRVLRQQIWP
jgi:protein-tyrosine kinase